MSDIAIKVENLSKLYQLGEIGTGTLSRDLERWWANIRGKEDPFAKVGQVNDRTQKSESDFVWALKDINFEVKQGEVLGIIGRNGAGKSTLLKILSKITSPTTGKIHVNGRIASLLEVGTGFHPEMTGRENIYMNGALLGMRKWEIDKKFDEIVDFAGVEAYIDTPVKRYSSGMYVRLAFAVAAFLEPDILIVDEVLAVGDAEFQKKCLGRMKDVSENDGRTVLFVSHDLSAIENLCKWALLIDNGQKIIDSFVSQVVFKYSTLQRVNRNFSDLYLAENIILKELNFEKDVIFSGDDLEFTIKIEFSEDDKIFDLSILIYNSKNIRVAIIDLRSFFDCFKREHKTRIYNGVIQNINFIEGEYFIGLHYNINNSRDDIFNLTSFEIKSKVSNELILQRYKPIYRGIVELIHNPKKN
jgi:lipopolysaccharide transport system ATP-binding protein